MRAIAFSFIHTLLEKRKKKKENAIAINQELRDFFFFRVPLFFSQAIFSDPSLLLLRFAFRVAASKKANKTKHNFDLCGYDKSVTERETCVSRINRQLRTLSAFFFFRHYYQKYGEKTNQRQRKSWRCCYHSARCLYHYLHFFVSFFFFFSSPFFFSCLSHHAEEQL